MKNFEIKSLFKSLDLPIPETFDDVAQGLFDVRRDDNGAYFNVAGGFKNVNIIRVLADWHVNGTYTHTLYGRSYDYTFSIVATANTNLLVLTMGICTWESPLNGSGSINVVNSHATGELMLTLPKGTRTSTPSNWSVWSQSYLYLRDLP
jgi:hypothetical protein